MRSWSHPASARAVLVAAAGLRNLVAHQYGALEWARLYATASSSELDHLEAFCTALASKVH